MLIGVEGEWRHAFTERFAVTLFDDHVGGEFKNGGALPRFPADRLGVRLEQNQRVCGWPIGVLPGATPGRHLGLRD